MARNKEFDVDTALDTAMRVFWRNGYEGTSIQALEQATGLTRTSLYNAFGNKRALFERALTHYRDVVMSKLLVRLDTATTLAEGVRALLYGALDLHFDEHNPGGCLVVLSVLEREQHDGNTRAMLQGTVQALEKEIGTRLGAAKKSGELAADLDVRGITAAIGATMAGLMVMAQAGLPRATLRKAVDQVVTLLR